jgi:uncharacterized protein
MRQEPIGMSEPQEVHPHDHQPTASDQQNNRLLAAICHLSTLVTPFFLANIIVPFAIWMAKRDESDLIDDQGREVLNFQITMLIAYVVALVSMATVILIPVSLGFFLVINLWHLGFSVYGAIRAYDGHHFRYPLTLRFL